MATTKWALDAAHSEIQFKVKHMMIATVTGSFKSFQADVTTEGDDFTTAKIAFSADIASVDTGNEQRDGHLRSADFFDAEQFPVLAFSDGKLAPNGDNVFKLTGTLSIRGVSQPVTLDAEFGGVGVDPWGNTKAGFTLSGKINRKDWGLNWNAALEAGGVLVSEDVRLLGEIQLSKA
jgi:polyisoprenoid-binding protein YceI